MGNDGKLRQHHPSKIMDRVGGVFSTAKPTERTDE